MKELEVESVYVESGEEVDIKKKLIMIRILQRWGQRKMDGENAKVN